MANPKLNLDPDHISDFLNEPNIESTTPSITGLMPPLPCRMTVTLDEVIAYDRNPRRTKNPNYDSIKESIRNRGLDDEPTITRRSIDEPFMIRSGGNTRLAILAELYQEYQQLAQEAENAGNTDDAQNLRLKSEEYYRFEWNYKPWEGETNALIGHMAENEERGDMIYIEKALAIKELQEIFNKEKDLKKPLSARKLAEKVTESGWTISNNSVSLMLYTANELDGILQQALWAGLGRPQILKLRALSNTYSKFCTTQNLSADFFQKMWHEVLTICDDKVLNIDSIRRYADQLVSDEIRVEYFTVTAEIDAMLSGSKPVIREVPLNKEQITTNTQNNVVDFQTTASDTHSSNDNNELSKEHQKTNANQPPSKPVTAEQLIDLRQQIYIDVVTLGMAFNLIHYVNKSSSGLGFFIDPVQEGEDIQTKADIENSPENISRNAIWLYLKQLSLHNLIAVQGNQVPVEQAVSGSDLTPDVFFTLNSHFHLMRLMDRNIRDGINKIEKSINILLQAAEDFYGEDALYQLFKD